MTPGPSRAKGRNDRSDQAALFETAQARVEPAENVDAVECVRDVTRTVAEGGTMTADLAARI